MSTVKPEKMAETEIHNFTCFAASPKPASAVPDLSPLNRRQRHSVIGTAHGSGSPLRAKDAAPQPRIFSASCEPSPPQSIPAIFPDQSLTMPLKSQLAFTAASPRRHRARNRLRQSCWQSPLPRPPHFSPTFAALQQQRAPVNFSQAPQQSPPVNPISDAPTSYAPHAS